ncbi:hypothetical protein J3R80_05835 [Aliiroseovarius sp. Z3]|uniref:hypothetical protein n=1 Tax=Aliiroseovarius sp. Z3 TaxID=2811402 RepID=UPI0023B2F937|nr:hypothetical protein [Aliiroseovarius sp. Z3]MDE9449987.1 hypothetical protein [Aliiroseovarius sp. Z3]
MNTDQREQQLKAARVEQAKRELARRQVHNEGLQTLSDMSQNPQVQAAPTDQPGYEQLMDAARNAHSAGQPDHAKRLVDWALRVQQETQAGVKPAQGVTTDQPRTIYEVQGPDGKIYEAEAPDMQSAVNAVKTLLAGNQTPAHDWETSALLGGSASQDANGIPRVNELMGGVLPSPRQAVRNLRENLFGDDDPTTFNRGEVIAAMLNKGGEGMTSGIVGDEAAGRFDQLIGRGDADQRTEFYRDQEEQLWEQHPGLALGAEIGGALVGPVKGAGAFINAGKGTGARMLRAGASGALSGATYGAMEGEDPESRLKGAQTGAGAGFIGGAALAGVGQGFLRAKQAISKSPSLKSLSPSLDQLKDSADALYKRVYESKVMFPKDRLQGLANGMVAKLRKEGFNERLHPRIPALFDELSEMVGQPQSLQQMEALRRIAGKVAKSVDPDERRLGSIAKEMIDESVAGLGGATKELAEARELWGRMKRVETIEDIIEQSANNPNFEKSIQSRFRQLLRNPRKNLAGFSEAEIAAIRQVARGGPVQRVLEEIGKRLSPQSLSGMGISGSAAYSGNMPLAVSSALTGIAAKSTAKASTRKGADQVRNMLARSPAQQRIIEELMKTRNGLASLSALSGGGMNYAQDK